MRSYRIWSLVLLMAAMAWGQCSVSSFSTSARFSTSALNANFSCLVSSKLASPFTTAGDTGFYDGASFQRLPIGTNGYCLLSNGASPYWAACPSGVGSVTSVFGRTGMVSPQSGDYNTSQVTENPAALYFNAARVRAAIAGSTPIVFDSATGIFTCPTCIKSSDSPSTGDLTGQFPNLVVNTWGGAQLTSANLGGTAMKRDSNGDVWAHYFYGTFKGEADTAKAASAAPTPCGSGQFVKGLNANFSLACDTPTGSGDVSGAPSSVNGHIAGFSGTSGKQIQDLGLAVPGSAIVGLSDSQSLTNKTITDPSNHISGAVIDSGTVAIDRLAAHSSTHSSTGTDPASIAWSQITSGIPSTFNAGQVQGRAVASTAPTDGQALVWNNSGSTWQPGTVSGGGSVNVNGSTVTTPNLNGTTPTAESGYTNVKFQVSGSNVSAELPVMTGDSGSGGIAGLVPAPSSGDAAAGKVLGAGGTWTTGIVCKVGTVDHTASWLNVASLTADYTVTALPANAVPLVACLYNTTVFSGTGISSLTFSLGTTGDLTAYSDPFYATTAVSDTTVACQGVFQPSGKAGHNLNMRATAVGANLSLLNAGTGMLGYRFCYLAF